VQVVREAKNKRKKSDIRLLSWLMKNNDYVPWHIPSII
jgi:hypothetical protein